MHNSFRLALVTTNRDVRLYNSTTGACVFQIDLPDVAYCTVLFPLYQPTPLDLPDVAYCTVLFPLYQPTPPDLPDVAYCTVLGCEHKFAHSKSVVRIHPFALLGVLSCV
jgi:hypothetical protein